MVGLTPAERVSRIKQVFGDGLTTKKGTKVQSTDSPLLYGALMRALHRKAQGLELSSLEQRLAGIWTALTRDATELAEHSNLYTQQDISASIPNEITDLSLEKPYTWEDLFNDSQKPEAGASLLVAATATANVVDLATVKPVDGTILGGPNSEFTFYTSSYTGAASAVANTTVYKICLEKFKCIARGDDSVFDPSNEIYWCYSSSDGNAKFHGVTGVYTDINSGSERYFDHEKDGYKPSDRDNQYYPLLWAGTMNKDTVVSAHIECWERDDGDSVWKEKLAEAMLEMSKTLTDSANESRAHQGRGVDYALILAAVTALLAGLLELLKNPDDCVLKRTIFLDWDALCALWYHNAYASDVWHFDGGSEGKHDLTLRYFY